VSLTLYWRVTGQPRRDYKIFVHLLDAKGRIVAQADAPPMEGTYPTSAWQVGEVLADGHRPAIPPDAKKGGGSTGFTWACTTRTPGNGYRSSTTRAAPAMIGSRWRISR